jgi:hypothetical protein
VNPPLPQRHAWLEAHAPWLAAAGQRAVWALDRRGRASRSQLRAMKGRHAGERCVIIGNGPSLREMDLRPLAGERTFTLNRGYLLYDRIGSPSTYHVVVNPLVAEQWADEILALRATKFAAWGLRHFFGRQAEITFVGGPSRSKTPRFSKDVARDLWPGATVTYAALQIAYYLAFQRVILIGVDHRFSAPGAPHQEVIQTGDDRNHFDPSYFGKGSRWNLPDLEASEMAYRLAREAYEKDGREILDATVGGALNVFPKVDYRSVFVT